MATKKYKLTHDGVTIGNGTEGIPYSLSYEDGLLSLLRDGEPTDEPIDLFLNHLSTDVIIRYRITYNDSTPDISNDDSDPTNPDYYNSSADNGWKSSYDTSGLTDRYYVWMAISRKTGDYIDPAWSISRINAYDGVDGSDGETPSPIVNVYFNPGSITYPVGSHRDYDGEIEVCAYYGSTLCEIKEVWDISLNTDIQFIDREIDGIIHYYIDAYRAELNSHTLFRIQFDTNPDQNIDGELIYRTASLNVLPIDIPTTDVYSLMVTPNTLMVDVDNLLEFRLQAIIYKNGQIHSVDYNNNETLEWILDTHTHLDYTLIKSITPLTQTCTISSDYESESYTTELNNSDFVTCTFKIDGQPILTQTIPFLRNSLLLASKYILRDRGTWTAEPNEPYRNDSVNGSRNLGENSYIDVVWYDDDVESVTDNTIERGYYMPIVSIVTDSVEPCNSDQWQKALSINFAYINTLIADVIKAQSIQANEVLLLNENNEIVAGMTSGDRIVPNENDSPVRIWAGGTKVSGNFDCNDLTLAPFRVYENGHVVALDLTLTINNELFKVDSDLILPKAEVGKIGYLTITNGTNHTISCDESFIMLLNGSTFSRNSTISLNENGVYFVCGQMYQGELTWFLTQTNYKEILSEGQNWVNYSKDGNGKLKFVNRNGGDIYLLFFLENDITVSGLSDSDPHNYKLLSLRHKYIIDITFTTPLNIGKDELTELHLELTGSNGSLSYLLADTFYFPVSIDKYQFLRMTSAVECKLGTIEGEWQISAICNGTSQSWNYSKDDYLDIPVTVSLYHLESVTPENKDIYTVPIAGTNSELLMDPYTHEVVGSVDFTSLKIYNTSGRSLNFSHNGDNYIVGPLVEELSLTDIQQPITPVTP